jgi:hypothetical protein
MINKMMHESFNQDANSRMIFFLGLFLISCFLSPLDAAVMNDVSYNPFSAKQIQRLINTKCRGIDSSRFISENNTSPEINAGIWAYEGQLINPITGQKICDVEGIELTRHVANFQRGNTKGAEAKSNGNEKLLEDLKVRVALFPSSNGTSITSSSAYSNHNQKMQFDWDYASTVISRKLFCYRDPKNQLLSSFKLRPGGKARKVSRKEAIALYDAATTYISSNNGRGLVIQTEFPNGRCVTAQATAPPTPKSSETNSIMEFTTFSKLTDSISSSLSPLLFPSSIDKDLSASSQVIYRPPRRRWIQFGPDTYKSLSERFGSRESYSYWNLDDLASNTGSVESTRMRNLTLYLQKLQFDVLNNINIFTGKTGDNTAVAGKQQSKNPEPAIKYTRYGECPPWYGPHQYCCLELVGRRVSSLQDAPSLAAKSASLTIPDFMSLLQTKQGGKTCTPTSNTTRCVPLPLSMVREFRLNQLYIPEYVDGRDVMLRNRILIKLRYALQRLNNFSSKIFR